MENHFAVTLLPLNERETPPFKVVVFRSNLQQVMQFLGQRIAARGAACLIQVLHATRSEFMEHHVREHLLDDYLKQQEDLTW